MSVRTSLESWIEWKRECALARCSEAVQSELARFGEKHVLQAFRTYDFNLAVPGKAAAERWHLFESYMHTSSRVTGKRWKDWLFETAADSSDDPVLVLERKTQTCIRSTVRKFCEDEGRTKDWKAGRHLVSMDAPKGVEEKAAILAETLGDFEWLDPSSQAEWAELQQIANKEADCYFSGMEQRALVALLANTLGLSLGHPQVEQAAGRKSSTLYATLNRPGGGPECSQLLEDFRLQIARTYEAEDARTIAALCGLMLKALRDRCVDWGKSEKACEPLFRLVEEHTQR